MRFRILVPLYLFYLSYRLLYWGLDDLSSIALNALFDAMISYWMAYGAYRKIEKTEKASSKITLIAILIAYYLMACLALWSMHWLVYSISGGMTESFSRSFYSPTFQFFDVITLLFIGAAITYAWLKNIEAKQKSDQYRKLIEENRIAELKFLKSQVNPHFIFNTLNAINFSIDKSNKTARSLVSDFADLFRYQLYESDQDYITLTKEINFIRKYVNIYEARMSENFKIDFQVEGSTDAKLLPPLLLIPFVENSFKHSSNHFKEKSIIVMRVIIEDFLLKFSIRNSKREGLVPKGKERGVGLSNVKKRLDILFPDDHNLVINETSDSFEVVLELPLKQEGLEIN